MKPADMHFRVLDLFSVLLPGAALLGALLNLGILKLFLPLLPPLDSKAEQWIVYALAAYALGHFVYLLASQLDRGNDKVREALMNPSPAALVEAERLQARMFGGSGTKDLPMNAYQWARAMLVQRAPAAAVDMLRYEADSKFFRRFVLVLLIVGVSHLLAGDFPVAGWTFIGAGLSYWCFTVLRQKAIDAGYRQVIVLLHGQGEQGRAAALSDEAPADAVTVPA